MRGVFVGVPSKSNKSVIDENTGESAGINLATLAAVHEFGSPKIGIPARSFLRVPFQNHKAQIDKAVKQFLPMLIKGEISEDEFLGQIGETAVDISVTAIENGEIPQNLKSATIRRKGSSRALIDTGALKNSITWEIR